MKDFKMKIFERFFSKNLNEDIFQVCTFYTHFQTTFIISLVTYQFFDKGCFSTEPKTAKFSCSIR